MIKSGTVFSQVLVCSQVPVQVFVQVITSLGAHKRPESWLKETFPAEKKILLTLKWVCLETVRHQVKEA